MIRRHRTLASIDAEMRDTRPQSPFLIRREGLRSFEFKIQATESMSGTKRGCKGHPQVTEVKGKDRHSANSLKIDIE
jgi:hypothetical protein